MYQPILVTVEPDGTVARSQIPLAGQRRQRGVARRARTRCAAVILPATLGEVCRASQYAVTGETAGTQDFNELMKSRMAFVIAFVLALAFLLLLATFRSIVIPITAIVLNLLSVGAAYGAARADLPAQLGGGDPRLHLERRDHLLAADVPVRRPLRALDGLPRVHPQPDQGAA